MAARVPVRWVVRLLSRSSIRIDAGKGRFYWLLFLAADATMFSGRGISSPAQQGPRSYSLNFPPESGIQMESAGV